MRSGGLEMASERENRLGRRLWAWFWDTVMTRYTLRDDRDTVWKASTWDQKKSTGEILQLWSAFFLFLLFPLK